MIMMDVLNLREKLCNYNIFTQDFKILIENCVLYIIGKLDDGGSFSNPNVIQKKRHSSAIEGRNKILKTEKNFKSGNYKNDYVNNFI
jgi:hypothetical protein